VLRWQPTVPKAEVVNDEAFVLPPAAVDTGASDDPLVSDDDDAALDVEEHDFSDDDAMVRSPCGTTWVNAARRFQLDTQYAIWFNAVRSAGKKLNKKNYEKVYKDGLQCVGSFGSVQDFWRYWNSIDLQKVSNFNSLSVFKKPVKPMWEDPANEGGGQWVFRCVDRVKAASLFTKLALALIGGYFDCHEIVCGVVFTTKPKISSVGMWSKKVNPHLVEPTSLEMRELLALDDCGIALEYKVHAGVRAADTAEGVQRSSPSPTAGVENGGASNADAGSAGVGDGKGPGAQTPSAKADGASENGAAAPTVNGGGDGGVGAVSTVHASSEGDYNAQYGDNYSYGADYGYGYGVGPDYGIYQSNYHVAGFHSVQNHGGEHVYSACVPHAYQVHVTPWRAWS